MILPTQNRDITYCYLMCLTHACQRVQVTQIDLDTTQVCNYVIICNKVATQLYSYVANAY